MGKANSASSISLSDLIVTKPKQSKKKKNKNSQSASSLTDTKVEVAPTVAKTRSPSPDEILAREESKPVGLSVEKSLLAKPLSPEEARSKFGANADIWKQVCSSISTDDTDPIPRPAADVSDRMPQEAAPKVREEQEKENVYMKTIPEDLSVAQQTPLKTTMASSSEDRSDLVEADVHLVTDRPALDKLVRLYCYCVDKNLVVNVMAELYVVLELFTVQEMATVQEARATQKKE